MDIRLVEPIASGAPFVATALAARVRSYAAGPREPLMLEALGISVPIVVRITNDAGSGEGTAIEIAAERNAALFPVFEGTIRTEPAGALNARIVLDGRYTVPLGLLGAAADRTILADVARASLQHFLARMRDEVAMDALRSDTAQ